MREQYVLPRLFFAGQTGKRQVVWGVACSAQHAHTVLIRMSSSILNVVQCQRQGSHTEGLLPGRRLPWPDRERHCLGSAEAKLGFQSWRREPNVVFDGVCFESVALFYAFVS